MFKKLRTAIYQVDDLKKAKEWYINVTGIQPYFDESFYVGFDIHGHDLGLHPGKATKNNPQALAYWQVDDIQSSVRKLLDAGAEILENITDVGGEIKVASVKDPWGNAVGLIEEAN
jgi:predicted enzyme related to lactoylglutathione lyase